MSKSEMQFSKTSGVTGLSNEFDKRGGPTGVKSPIYTQDSGRTNADRRQGSSGGEVRRSEILDRGGNLIKR
jgi:hypothetical protein